MSVTFWFEEYKSDRHEITVANSRAEWLLYLAEVQYRVDPIAGSLNPTDLAVLVYNLEAFILSHPDDHDLAFKIHYLIIFARLLGFAEGMGFNLKYG